jgi:hypothetical protein
MLRERAAVLRRALEPARPHPRAGGDGGGEQHRAHGEQQPEDEGAPEQVEEFEREEQDEQGQGEGGEGGRRGEEGVELRGGDALRAQEEGRQAGGEDGGAREEAWEVRRASRDLAGGADR